ncbi:efflux RND transporter permease subunit [Paenirhodobacter sp. CAU 1674]|uniref:efflux RND transporter permease subunit n=1 Tax=Paenirhodobacter sp. CAU 1674 TaxID=3032596 RepID=UPI0023DC2DC1|nr:efflux RND transporter permease subunit [Paenirhodobacter sp. CAU 1674]MDF2140015.1 efflux RND transporter permease subunit [Paenirhodobacter sp. CAU 1674]
MSGLIDWAAARARMVLAFVAMTVIAGLFAYTGLPKEGEPDIEIPTLFISVPFPGISAADSEKLLVKTMETELADLDGLKTMSGTALENYAGLMLEFDFGWDKTKIIADVRDAMNTAEGKFPDGAEKYTINEINFSEFPVVVVTLSGRASERTLLRLAKELQDRLEGLEPVLEATLAGHRDEMVEVLIDPLRLEAYNVTAPELIAVVQQNNQLIAAGEIETPGGAFSVKIPSSFDTAADIYALPVKTNGERVVTLGDLAEIRLTFEDRTGTARFNGKSTVALQIVKRKGYNIIDTVALVRDTVAAEQARWPAALQEAVDVGVSLDQSKTVGAMVSQLEGSVLTAIALVMIVVLATLGTRSALLVGFSIPTSFLLTFLLLGAMGVAISNIVMFGLILAVGMLVDGAIVIVEYADMRIAQGAGPMRAYTEAARRMFWPVVSSTATTLCAFLPMLFWPGVPGEFMGMLPVTIIFVLSASLVVALIYVPVVGGVAGRISRRLHMIAQVFAGWPLAARLALASVALAGVFVGGLALLNPGLLGVQGSGWRAAIPGAILFTLATMAASVAFTALRPARGPQPVEPAYQRRLFGHFTAAIAGNPVMPLVVLAAVVGAVVFIFGYYGQHNNGTQFFTDSEVEQGIIYVRARGNLSLDEKDTLLRAAEAQVLGTPGVAAVFSFAGEGGLNQNTGGAVAPRDTIGQIQVEMTRWEDRRDDPGFQTGQQIMEGIMARIGTIPGIKAEFLAQDRGPASGKPIQLRLKGDDFTTLGQAVDYVEAHLAGMRGITAIEDTRPLPGIDWEIDVDVTRAGRFGADVATVGGMVQLVTRGILLDTMRVDSSDEEIDIRVRLPEGDRVLSTLDTLKLRTAQGLVPLANFITRTPVPKLGRIDRVDQTRYFDVKADVLDGLVNDAGAPINGNERIAALGKWLETEAQLPAGVSWEWAGDMVDQSESQAFLTTAFAGALALMFVILLAQFNSFYNAVLVLLAVILSTAGVLVGMLVMGQQFSIIMTGVGIVALAGIVVNNNIILIDTFQEFSRYMPPIEAVIRTAEQRLRPVALTTITTMAGLAPMMFGLSLDFFNGGYSVDSPTALWWKQLATAVVFGLGIATVLTLILTPALLAIRIWFGRGAYRSLHALSAFLQGNDSRAARDLALERATRKLGGAQILWEDQPQISQDKTPPALPHGPA